MSYIAEYSGITVQNVLGKLESKEAVPALYLAEVWAEVLAETTATELSTVSKSALKLWLQSDRLNCTEIALFRCVLTWAEVHCGEDTTPEARAEMLKDVLSLIRFPRMELAEAAEVNAAEVLPMDQMLELYKFLALDRSGSHADIKVQAAVCIQHYNFHPRVPRLPPKTWSWKCSGSCKNTYSQLARTLCSGCVGERKKTDVCLPYVLTAPTTTTTTYNSHQSNSGNDSLLMEDGEVALQDDSVPIAVPLTNVLIGAWNCGMCTLENLPGAFMCCVCDTPNPAMFGGEGSSESKQQPDSTPFVAEVAPDGMWLCGLCSVANLNSATRCIACNCLKPNNNNSMDSKGNINMSVQGQGIGQELQDMNPHGHSWRRKLAIDNIYEADIKPFHISLRNPISKNIGIPVMKGIGWLALPHLGIYGDPYEISQPILVVDMPVQNVTANALGKVSPTAMKVFCEAPSVYVDDHTDQKTNKGQTEEGKQQVSTTADSGGIYEEQPAGPAAGAAGGAFIEHADAVQDYHAANAAALDMGLGIVEPEQVVGFSADLPSVISDGKLAFTAEEEAFLNSNATLDDSKEPKPCFSEANTRCAVVIHRYLDQSQRPEVAPLNLIAHPWAFGKTHTFGPDAFAHCHISMGIFDAVGLTDQLTEDLKHRDTPTATDCDAVCIDGMGFRVVDMHGAAFSPDNCAVYLDGKASVYSYMLVMQRTDEEGNHHRFMSFNIVPGSVELQSALEGVSDSSEYLEEFVENLLLMMTINSDVADGMNQVLELLMKSLGEYLA
jgi:hypothetical protein